MPSRSSSSDQTRIPDADIDLLLTAQIVVAWAGEGGEEPRLGSRRSRSGASSHRFSHLTKAATSPCGPWRPSTSPPSGDSWWPPVACMFYNVEQFDPDPFMELMPKLGLSWQIREA